MLGALRTLTSNRCLAMARWTSFSLKNALKANISQSITKLMFSGQISWPNMSLSSFDGGRCSCCNRESGLWIVGPVSI